MFLILRAHARDAQELANFAERSFRETFQADNTTEDMAAYCKSAFGLSKQSAELRDPERETWLALSDGDIIGYYQLIFNQREPAVKDLKPVELNRIYVDSKWSRTTARSRTDGTRSAASPGERLSDNVARRLGTQPPSPHILQEMEFLRSRRT